jgi:integrase
VARSNAHYGLPCRQYANGTNRAKALEADKLARITDAHVRMSLELQREFGLRREEAIKIRPALADTGDVLWLKASWTKGGRAREIPIRTESQKAALAKARALAGNDSLIPSDKNYKEQKNRYEGQCIRVGLSRMHGLRHAYAQRRFAELAGFKAPLAGGPNRSELSNDQRALDQKARAEISNELGHKREQITTVYLGR